MEWKLLNRPSINCIQYYKLKIRVYALDVKKIPEKTFASYCLFVMQTLSAENNDI